MLQPIKLAALAHSKHRNAIGLVGLEADPLKKLVTVRLAKQWAREQINNIAPDVGEMYRRFKWFNTIVDFSVGDHVILGLRRYAGLPIRVIHVQKKVKDHLEIERVKTMDIIEATQYALQLKLAHKILFPTKPSEDMKELEQQVALFSEHKTEAGSIDYYAPGDEFDNLTKALIINLFAARPYLQGAGKVIGGAIDRTKIKTKDYSMQFIEAVDPTNRVRRKF